MTFKTSLLLLFTFIISLSLSAQDAILTQYHRAPLHLSPANAGTQDAPQANINYRYHWNETVDAGRFHTADMGFHTPISLGSNNRIGFGLSANTDRSVGTSYRHQGVALHGNYQRKIFSHDAASHWLSGGIRAGYFQQKISLDELRWGNQNNNGTFNPNLPGAPNLPDEKNYFDLGIGFGYTFKLDKNRFLQVGYSIFHLNKPSIEFTDSDREGLVLTEREHLFLTARLGLGETLYLLPRALAVIQGQFSFVDLGSELEIPLGKLSLLGGAGFRLTENFDTSYDLSDLIFSLGFNTQRFTFAASYDMDASPEFINRLNTRSLEVAVLYQFAGKINN